VIASAGVLAAAAGAGIGPGLFTGTAQAATKASAAGQALLASTFTGKVGHVFSFTGSAGETVMLRLEAVEAAGRHQDRTEHTFALRFSGPGARRQGGAVGRLSGSGIAPTTLLVVPSGRVHRQRQDWVATVVGSAR
jgi:hypothetical protein